MNFKTCKINVKEAGNQDFGRICGYASTYDRIPDSYGDIVAPGAFDNALKKLADKESSKLPFLENHNLNDFDYNIGYVDVLEDKDKGLYFEAVFDDTPRAQRARKLFRQGRITQFSFAYDILDQGEVELEDGTKANELRELDIFEISAVTVPANQFAEMVEVKGGDMPKKAEEQMQEEQNQEQAQEGEMSPKDKIDKGLSALFAKLEDEIREFVYEAHDIESDKACNPDDEDKKACQTDEEEDKKADKPEDDSEAEKPAEDSEEDLNGEQEDSTDEEEVDKDNSKSNERLLTFIDTLRIV